VATAHLDRVIELGVGYPLHGDWEASGLHVGGDFLRSRRLNAALEELKWTSFLVRKRPNEITVGSSSYVAERLLKDGWYEVDRRRSKEIEEMVRLPLSQVPILSSILELIENHTTRSGTPVEFVPPWEIASEISLGRVTPVADEEIFSSMMASITLKTIVPLKTTKVLTPRFRHRFLPETSRWESIYREILKHVLRSGSVAYPSKGATLRVVNHRFELDDPKDRLTANPARHLSLFQVLGHTLWTMAGREDLESIRYYNPRAGDFSSDGKILGGAYGPRLFSEQHGSQFEYVRKLLKEDPWTRNAYIHIYNATRDHIRPPRGNAGGVDERPCTASLQFLPSGNQLDMIVNMRSQSLLAVLPIDLFLFTFLHEYLARLTGYVLGHYMHQMADGHIYLNELGWCRRVLTSDPRPAIPMPEMPTEDPEHWLKKLIEFEGLVREQVNQGGLQPGAGVEVLSQFPQYWRQLGLVLLTVGCSKVGDLESASPIVEMLDESYRGFTKRAVQPLATKS
jgi:thymidylate synthase